MEELKLFHVTFLRQAELACVFPKTVKMLKPQSD